VLYIFKMVSVLTFLKIVLLIEIIIIVKILPIWILRHWKIGKINCNVDK